MPSNNFYENEAELEEVDEAAALGIVREYAGQFVEIGEYEIYEKYRTNYGSYSFRFSRFVAGMSTGDYI